MRTKLYLTLLILLLPLLSSCADHTYDSFAKCLTKEGMTFYGTFWCSHCAEMKNRFGESFKYITYVECDARGQNARPDLCTQRNIGGYPTFEFKDGLQLRGERTFQEFADITKCQLPE